MRDEARGTAHGLICHQAYANLQLQASAEKREVQANTLNTRVGAFTAEACYSGWCETKHEVAERAAKEARKAKANTVNTRVGAFSAEACYSGWCETKREVRFHR